ncbi:unnamed protein product [Ilex paraguariensis]|uniref:Zinc finger ZPR1-type domain-containing protein n=1 Tax=Ilex paraguariensis TaxID=185542 RepID=A0ABC8T9F2_9AQUA
MKRYGDFSDLYSILQSDTASVKVPELDLELTSGTLGGIVTTVEGLIRKISENLERVHGFTFGDSLDDFKRSKWLDFQARLNKELQFLPVVYDNFFETLTRNAGAERQARNVRNIRDTRSFKTSRRIE